MGQQVRMHPRCTHLGYSQSAGQPAPITRRSPPFGRSPDGHAHDQDATHIGGCLRGLLHLADACAELAVARDRDWTRVRAILGLRFRGTHAAAGQVADRALCRGIIGCIFPAGRASLLATG